MSLAQHTNHQMRYNQQIDNAVEFVIPFIEKKFTLNPNMNVLEIGCGEGGVLKSFFDKGCYCVGVDLDQFRIDLAHEFLKKEIESGNMLIINKNITDEDFINKYDSFFDLIILKDVIEHIHDQKSFFPFLKKILKDTGQIFFGFPPWYMPFGGHQQVAQKKITSMLPYYHLLPTGIYKWVLKIAGESKETIINLLEVKQTGISIERFEKICNQTSFEIVHKKWYLINPIYKYKFNLKPRKQYQILSFIPFVRNFFTTCAYYTIKKLK